MKTNLLHSVAVLLLSSVVVTSKTLLGSHSNHIPLVEGVGIRNQFIFPDFPFGKLGGGFKIDTDVYGGYSTDVFYLEGTSNYLVANPILYIEAGLRS